ncbi:hypothetical protein JDV02_000619 [Purpureocillium takamizusanense]|uniref:Zn(2)-C6 fungal-type domain-containing protein n=1 Tax=Purpureocillium takamizusanense TaxID=2060973 RepID=A0A9Q8Q576_9HYPO|nr:uncharacterized protein JDV02_000619 [Purpureocillium takamizusanense]UNI13929.1 hypothetical protein JDV02_000619 [Purpureocillium takamizusanense]
MADAAGRMQTPTGTPSRQTQQQHRRPRLRLACLRCQRRKIRCDGQLPTCKNCQNAGASCTDGQSARLKDLPRAYIVALKDRISWLESILQERCPDIDLSDGPCCAYNGDGPEESTPVNTSSETLDNTRITPLNPGVASQQQASAADLFPEHARQAGRSAVGAMNANPLSHEIGLVSLGTNLDSRYIGPSSGYFLARVMLTGQYRATSPPSRDSAFSTRLVEAAHGPLDLPQKEMAEELCDQFFELIHPQYPVLHRPTFTTTLSNMYGRGEQDPLSAFQVYMVLAISCRLKSGLPGESYCMSALKHFDRLNVENSLQGLQCLILLTLFAMHSPSVRLNVWYLNYQCIAAVLDLGLQRNITTRSGISLFEQEMRTRIFWVVFTLDRAIATMMGRPIGLRDEACELRLPEGLDDAALASSQQSRPLASNASYNPIAYSVHLFRLARINSEIKYVANSIVRDAPAYAYPTVIDIHEWQRGVLRQLDEWANEIPPSNELQALHMRLICQQRYHSLRMVLLRPSPAIPKPTTEAVEQCYHSAQECLHIFDKLYRKNLLVHSWTTFYSLALSTLTLLYCLKTVAKIAQDADITTLMSDLNISSSILSATGEHWSGAKRCRDILNDLGRSIIRQLVESGRQIESPTTQRRRTRSTVIAEQGNALTGLPGCDNTVTPAAVNVNLETAGVFEIPMNLFDDFLTTGSFADYLDGSDTNMDMMMQGLFDDFGSNRGNSG